MINALKQKLRDGRPVVGCFVGFHSPAIVEMLGYSGFDFVVIDNEHGPFSWGEVEDMIRAAEGAGVVPIVRVAYDPSDIQKALDRGAYGIHVPMVNTKQRAEEVVQRAKYPPEGKRGAAFSCRSAKFGKVGGTDYLETANRETLVAVHIETLEAANNIEEIMDVEGIDVYYLGPTDMSVTMGYGSEPNHPDVQAAMNRVLASGRKRGAVIGTQVGSAEGVRSRWNWGAQYIGVGITPVLMSAFKEVASVKLERPDPS